MLNERDNELITRVGPGTPMGSLLREYWLPAFQSQELTADGDQLRLRLLGEDLVAFRDTAGNIGVLGEHCPHRGASLFLGRNEECGLRCVYHGWKFDVTGQCVEMPNEPPEADFAERVKQKAYRTIERRGVVWVYMGSEDEPPKLPDLGWNVVPEDHKFIDRRLQSCNFVQAIEGGIDHTHTGFLHRTSEPIVRARVADPKADDHPAKRKNLHPRFETLERDYGVAIAACREDDPEVTDWHITHFLMPFFTVLTGNNPASGHAWVPMDDYRTITWSVTWNPRRPLLEQERLNLEKGGWIHSIPAQMLPPTTDPEGNHRPIGSRENDWLLDRDLGRDKRFVGIPIFWLQDQAVQESMGPIYDRRQEHLGTADAGVIQMRRCMLKAARALQTGMKPTSLDHPQAYNVYGANIRLPAGTPWEEGAGPTVWPETTDVRESA